MPVDRYTGSMPDQYLDYPGVAARTGIAVSALRKYLSTARTNRENGVHSLADFPEPDIMIGRSPGWKPTTIDRWLKRRPGRGVGGAEARERYRRERGA